MNNVVLLFVITVFCVILCFTGGICKRIEEQEKRIKNLKKKRQEFVNEELKIPFFERIIKPILNGTQKYLVRTKKDGSASSKERDKLERTLKTAGFGISPEEFNTLRVGGAIIMCGVGVAVGFILKLPVVQRIGTVVMLGAIIYVGSLIFVSNRAKIRQEKIKRQMPDVMDLLVVSVEAGLGFDSAITRLYKQNKGPLMEELMTTIKDVQMGRNRREALKELGDRNDIPELRVFATSMIQAEQLGISIKNVLVTQADKLRIGRKQAAEEKAMKAPIKMMLPMVAFIFPVLFIILLGPAAMSFMNGGLG